jgi:hypothetical protein
MRLIPAPYPLVAPPTPVQDIPRARIVINDTRTVGVTWHVLA